MDGEACRCPCRVSCFVDNAGLNMMRDFSCSRSFKRNVLFYCHGLTGLADGGFSVLGCVIDCCFATAQNGGLLGKMIYVGTRLMHERALSTLMTSLLFTELKSC